MDTINKVFEGTNWEDPDISVNEDLSTLMLEFKLENLNIIHYAILLKNVNAIKFLLNNNFFKMKDKDILCYLHLAILTQHVKSIEILVKNYKDFSIPNKFWPPKKTILKFFNDPKVEIFLDHVSSTPNEALFAVEVAAQLENTDCLNALFSHNTRIAPIVGCIEANSLKAFKLLLPDCNKESFDAALFTSLKLIQPDYVKILIEDKNMDKSALPFQPYHVVFMEMCGPSAGRHCIERFVSLISLLIEHGFNVNSHSPHGYYPLYSGLHAMIFQKDTNPAEPPEQHIKCLKMLLKAGADPNYDERLFSVSDQKKMLYAEKRELFSSSLNAFFTTLQGCDTWRPYIMEHMDNVCLSLLEAGAYCNSIDNESGETPLHTLMKTAAIQHAIGHVHADFSCMCRMLLYFGADPNHSSDKVVSPVHYYFNSIVNTMGGAIAFQRWEKANVVGQIMMLLYYMDRSDALKVTHSILQELKNAIGQGSGINEPIIEYVKTKANEYNHTIWSLQDLSKLSLWKLVNRRVHTIKELAIPRSISESMKSFFVLDI